MLVEDFFFVCFDKVNICTDFKQFKLIFSNDLTFSNTKRPCLFSIYLKILNRANRAKSG